MNRIILPGIGDLRLGELTVGTLDRFLKTEAERGLTRGRHARVVLAQILDLAVRHDALPRNPVRSTAPMRRSRSDIRSLTIEELTEIRRLLREHRRESGMPGPPPNGQLAQIFEVMLGTSARLGEALAIHCPGFTREALRQRLATAGDLALEQTVFRTKQGTPLSPANVRRLWRSIRDASAGLLPEGMDLAQVVPHTLRKTVATALDDAAGTDLAAELLGHSSTAVTRAHYVQPRKRVDPKTAEILEGLRPRDPKQDQHRSPGL